jgi:ABC-type nitrate/sulfonate/bicarbonate transport system substrate-binding protein
MMTIATHAKKRVAAVAGLILATALSLTACAGPSSGTTEAKDPIKFQTSWLPSVQFSGSYIADSKGYYAQEGLDVTLLPGGPDVDPQAAIASGQVDIALSNADFVARTNAQGADLVIVAAGFQKDPFAVLSAPNAPIKTPQDMIGKRIGVPTADAPLFDTFLSLNNIDPAKLTVVPVGFDVAPLVSGEVDGLVSFYTEQPTAYKKSTGKDGVTMMLGDFGLDVYAQVYVVQRKSLKDEKSRARIEHFLRAELKGWNDYVNDIPTAVDLTVNKYAKDGGLSPEQQLAQATLQRDLLNSPDTEANGLLWLSKEGIERNLATIKALGIKGADASLFDTSIREKLAK